MLGENIVVAIVGNKMDLEKNRKVTQAQAEEYVIAPCHTPFLTHILHASFVLLANTVICIPLCAHFPAGRNTCSVNNLTAKHFFCFQLFH